MFSEGDLQDAVAAGAISAEAAQALRDHVAARQEAPSSDEEYFRLVASFNDVFVAIAVILVLVATGAILTPGGPLAIMGVAGAAWAMGEFFSRKRRMALPSIVLALAFIGGVTALFGLAFAKTGDMQLFAGMVAAAAAWIHWLRFRVPIAIAAGAGSLCWGVVAYCTDLPAWRSFGDDATLVLTLALGLVAFAFAMRWDVSDRHRATVRSDVAFWLHLLAAPMIAHPLFAWLGISLSGDITLTSALAVLALYLVFATVALAIDRRALLVSALAYVLVALGWLFREFGAVEEMIGATTLIIGSALLAMAVFWAKLRATVLGWLPARLRDYVPPVA